MPDDTRDWLEADLAAHSDRVLVVLNHEPFHFDPEWPFEPDPGQTADDEGLFGRYGVDYVLTGHVHFNSFQKQGSVTHITTGALSGFRWVLPPGVHERGYRLFLARDRQLHSAWKSTGQPVLGWSEGGSQRIAVAADRDGPFASISVERDSEPIPVERLGLYFVRLPDDVGGRGALRIVGKRASGEAIAANLP